MDDTANERKRSPKQTNGNATKSSYGSARASSASPSPAGVSRRPAPPSRTRTPNSNSKTSAQINKDPSFDDLVAQGDAEDSEAYARSSREALIAALKRVKADHAETQSTLENTTRSFDELSTTHAQVLESVHTAESKLQEAHAEQARMESELSESFSSSDKYRNQVSELEKQLREAEKRSHDEVATFDAERKAWQDTEARLKSRIEKLNSTPNSEDEEPKSRKKRPPRLRSSNDHQGAAEVERSSESGDEHVLTHDSEPTITLTPDPSTSNMDFSSSIEEMTQLQTSLSLISQERDHLQHYNSDLIKQTNQLSEQLAELKRINANLTDESDSFQLLLGERTLSGQILGQGLFGQRWDDETASVRSVSDSSRRFQGSPLLGVLEEDGDSDSGYLESSGSGRLDSGAVAAGVSRRKPKKESKAPTVGLNLAAELDRAQEETMDEEDDEVLRAGRARHGRETSSASYLGMNEDSLRAEVKALRDANKALSLYIAKIVERVIAHEGFEKVLATDYSKSRPNTPQMAEELTTFPSSKNTPSSLAAQTQQTPKAVNMSKRASIDLSASQPARPVSPAGPADEQRKTNRLSLSGLAASIWKTGPKSPPAQNSNLKPMLLASSMPASSGQGPPLHQEDDEEDAITRARLRAEMQLLGYDQHGSPSLHQARNASPEPVTEQEEPVDMAARRASLKAQRRSMSFNTSPNLASLSYIPPTSEASSPRLTDSNLSASAKMAATAARDKEAMDNLNQGKASAFTEMHRRPSVRRRESSTGSQGSMRYSTDNERPIHTPPQRTASPADGWTSKLLRRVSMSTSPQP